MEKVKLTIVKWPNTPAGAMQIYNPKFRNIAIEEIEEQIDFESNWLPYGYNRQMYCWTTSTVFITK